ncbi:MAG: alkaline phosphatase family protein [Chloroflexota bacterium]|nr:alkaline phosphatase family protein [Dehalococcoidia bacterium]MDW8253670.1 alkaline phosphatase family protein [Chloroflexota bacterium]
MSHLRSDRGGNAKLTDQTDVHRLLRRFEEGSLLRPSAASPNIVDLSRALAHVAGADTVDLTPTARKLAALIGDPDHLIFILADGLGMNLVERLPRDNILAAAVVDELRTVFPSTSSVALTSLATGTWPNLHGVTGQWTHLPEAEAAAGLLQFATRAGGRSLASLGITVSQAFPIPSVYAALRRDTIALFPDNLVNSVSSAYFTGERVRGGYRALTDAVDFLVDRIARACEPTYSYLYAPQIDLEAHYHGVFHPMVGTAIAELSRQVERLARSLNGRSRIVITADHGLLDTPVTARHYLRPSAGLFEALRFPPSGDSRVLYLHVRDGAADRVRAWFHHHYGSRFLVISTDEAERLELFGPGPLSSHTRARLGDLIVISTGTDVIEYAPGKVDRFAALVSHHSGLTPSEMRVPFIVI